ncbi:hypothetical protein V8E53_010914 [Lactarius tabidus]
MPPSSQPVDQVGELATNRRPPCSSKTKAMHDAPWRALKPRSYPNSKKPAAASGPTARHKKKCKVSSKHVQLTVALHEDVPKDRHRHGIRSRESDEDHLSDLPPNLARRKRTLDSEDNKSDQDQEDLQNLNGNELARTFDNEAIQWTQNPSQMSQHIRRNSGGDEDSEAGSGGDDSDIDIGHPLSDESSTCPESRRILTKRAASRYAEAIEFSDSSNDKNRNPDRPRFVGPHNSGWRHTPYLPAGPGQRNICINAQPVHLKAILKHTIKCLTQDCAFKHGYIPVEQQTECLVRILHLSAEKMNRPYYTERVQKDSLLQRVICDLLNVCVSHYWTGVKRVAACHVTGEYGLSDNKPEHEQQVATLLLQDKFIFLPKEGDTGTAGVELELPPAMVAMAAVAVHASLDETVTGLDFNADTYEDSYNTFISFLEQIRKQKLLAYHRLMSDLFKLVSSQDTHSRNKSQNAMWLLDMDGMDE